MADCCYYFVCLIAVQTRWAGETRACVVCDLPEEVVGCEDYITGPHGCKKI